jgi:hypothetical protein
MARPPIHRPVDPETGRLLFLGAIADLPWATQPAIEAYSGLFDWEIERQYRPLASQRGLIERGDIRAADGRGAPRLGLTPEGARVIGRPWRAAHLRAALLQALTLDAARRLISEWVDQVRQVVWALSPFTLPPEAVRPVPTRHRPQQVKFDPEYRYGAVQFGVLAALQLRCDPDRYANVAILIDPGDIRLTWLGREFRSLYAWRQRREFHHSMSAYPLAVLVAANNARRTQLIRLWRASAPPGAHLLRIRVTTYAELACEAAVRSWWNEHGQRISLWSGASEAERPGIRPIDHNAGWWGMRTMSLEELRPRRPRSRFSRRKRDRPLIASARSSDGKARDSLSSKLVRWQLDLSAQRRRVLRCVGNYPLLRVVDLALVMGINKAMASAGLKALREVGLVEQPRDHDGHVLTWAGVTLLAAQDGLYPGRYAELRRWPVAYDSRGQPRYSVEALLAQPGHTAVILGFLVGLRRFGPAQGISLRIWDHVLCLLSFLDREQADRSRRVIPDAVGRVQATGGTETTFWLEVDRGTVRGRALTRKLMRYYIVGGPQPAARGLGVRLLVVVGLGDEGRLRTLQRCFRDLDQRYQAQLDVRLTREDLLDAGHGRLNPTRPVWRTAYGDDFLTAFGAAHTPP